MKTRSRANNFFIALIAFVAAAPCAVLIVVMGQAVLDGAIDLLLKFGR